MFVGVELASELVLDVVPLLVLLVCGTLAPAVVVVTVTVAVWDEPPQPAMAIAATAPMNIVRGMPLQCLKLLLGKPRGDRTSLSRCEAQPARTFQIAKVRGAVAQEPR